MYRKFSLGLWAILFFVASPKCWCQTLDDAGLWFAGFGNGKFESLDEKSPLRWWFDTHYRMTEDAGGFNQSIIRPGLGLEVAEAQTLWAGYAWIYNSPVVGEDFGEHRIWQQWTATPSNDDWKFLHRSRLEQRMVESGDEVGFRWRQMHRAQRVLTDSPQWSLIGWNEIFFHLNDTDWGTEMGLDQNRAFLGFGYKRTPESRVRTEIGYLNQFINRQGGLDGMNHILSINWFY